MRIIAGKARGCRLFLPKGIAIRPTTDRVREALFNILANRIQDMAFLDLYAGSGSVGLEALSRGASLVVFVDNNPRSISVLMKNVEKSRFPQEKIVVQRGDVLQVLKKLNKEAARFDIVFMDPPYASGHVEPTLSVLGNTSLLKPDGLVVVEHGATEEVPRNVSNLGFESERKYGDTVLSFYKWSHVV